MAERRYEISILIGPCEQDEAEEALEHVILATDRDLVGFGAAFALRPWVEARDQRSEGEPR